MRKKQKEFIERSNADAGFSLIEMVVTVLITSILMLAVGLFMSSSNSIYQTVGTSSKLQEESLSASNFLNEILLESVNIAYSPDSSSTKYWVVKALDNDDSADKGEKDSTTGLWSTIDYDYYIFLLTKASGETEYSLRYVKVKEGSAGGITGDEIQLVNICDGNNKIDDARITDTIRETYIDGQKNSKYNVIAQKISNMEIKRVNDRLFDVSIEYVFNGKKSYSNFSVHTRNTVSDKWRE